MSSIHNQPENEDLNALEECLACIRTTAKALHYPQVQDCTADKDALRIMLREKYDYAGDLIESVCMKP